MNPFLYVLYFLFVPCFALQFGCFKNATFSGLSASVWLNNTINCRYCICQMVLTNSVASNCYNNVTKNTSNCLIFSNYSSITGNIQVVSGQYGSFGCFTQFPPISVSLTTMSDITTAPPFCAGYIQSTILLQLYNAPNQTYTRYSYVYQATSNRTKIVFCFLNRQYFWALDDVSIKDVSTNNELLENGDFEQVNWNDWTHYNSIYYGSGITNYRFSWSAYTGSKFYLDMQYTAVDGIYQTITAVPRRNYTISFYLANPRGGNVSVAIVSIG